eukprot:15375-Heterococcus_DN1.PRE.1
MATALSHVKATQVQCGGFHTAVLDSDGAVYTFGKEQRKDSIVALPCPYASITYARGCSLRCKTATVDPDHGLLGCSNHGLLTGGLNVPHLIALQQSPQQQQQQQTTTTADTTAAATAPAPTAVALHRETSVVAEDTTTDSSSSSSSTSSSVKASIVACGGWHTFVVDT